MVLSLGAVTVSPDRLALFLRLSGDSNPIHWDAVAARRLMFGQVVVPGVHTVLAVLDRWLATEAGGAGFHLSRLSASLKKPMFVAEDARLAVKPRNGGCAIEVAAGDTVLARVTIHGEWTATVPWHAPHCGEIAEPVLDLDADAIGGAAGQLPPHGDSALELALFPAIVRHLGTGVATRLAAISRLVGCRCPGLHSLLADFDVTLDRDSADTPLAYEVTDLDRRFQWVSMRIAGFGLNGTVAAMIRPPPTSQPKLAALGRAPGVAEGHRPLIVGESRGLGELTAKLVAASGGEPAITYRTGEADARRVQAEIAAAGLPCHVMALDVRDCGQPTLPAGWRPNALYYFATPRIFTRRTEAFSYPLFLDHAAYCVDGFARMCALMDEWSAGTAVSVFYPSTTALGEPVPGLAEYAAAKAAGEQLCRALRADHPKWTIVLRRLPRLATDQTALVAPVIQLGTDAQADAVAAIRAVVAAMAAPLRE